jgi:hypothetical protein
MGMDGDRIGAKDGNMVIRVLAAALIFVGLLTLLSKKVGVGKSRLTVTREQAHFPVVTGTNLMRVEFEFPRDFEGKYNLLFIPFQQWQQREVNTWIPAAQQLEREEPSLIYYELPTIYELPALSRTFINEGMRAGIPDQTSRERTVTFYLDKETFKNALGITAEQSITVMLVDQEGNILWREGGEFAPEKLESLQGKLNELE